MNIKSILSVVIINLISFSSCSGMSETPNEKLFRGAFSNNIELVQKALKEGADVNAKDKDGNNVLNYLLMNTATPKKYINIIKLLLDAGINADEKNQWGHSPSYAAWGYFPQENQDKELIKLLKEWQISKETNLIPPIINIIEEYAFEPGK